MAQRPKLEGGWIQQADGTVSLVVPQLISATEMGLVVGLLLKWTRKSWKPPLGSMMHLQLGIPPHIAREVARALIQAADLVERGTGRA